jgi:type I restriction enzyme, R subunit
MDKKQLSERDICTKFITPALRQAGWDEQVQLREEVTFTKGRVIVRGRITKRGKAKRADYILYFKSNIPLAVIEAKDNHASVGDGLQQALEYADTLQLPFVFSSNGDGFVFHDRTSKDGPLEQTLALHEFPSPSTLWARYREWKGLPPESDDIVLQDYYTDGSDRGPRYYQASAVNAAVEAVAKGQNRLLLVMATGTGKTYTAFQIIWRLWRAKRKKRVLFLVDRNVLADQTMVNDFRPFGGAMAKLSTGSKVIGREDGTEFEIPLALDNKRRIDTSYEIYLGLYQAITGPGDKQKIYRELSPDFFDLIVVDECHRGSAADDSAWREILTYFGSATQIGMTATPKETQYVSNIHYFGPPVYSYSLKQGIQDGFLAPYKVVKVHIDRDIEGYRPEPGKVDDHGQPVEDRIYNTKDFDRTLVLDNRTKLVARKVTQFLKETDRFQKTIVFCVDTEHAARMRQALVNENADICRDYPRYVMRITGNDKDGVAQLDNFTDPETRFPVVVTTSQLLSTGVDVQTCRVIALDREIGSMTEFKQIVGRGTRIHEDTHKLFFTLIDFRKATNLFAPTTLSRRRTLRRQQNLATGRAGKTAVLTGRLGTAGFHPGRTPGARRPTRSSTWAGCPPESWPNGSSTSTARASWSPKAYATTADGHCAVATLASMPSSPDGTRPSGSTSSLSNWRPRACRSTRWPAMSVCPWTRSIWSAMWCSTSQP